jgi:hypothetical protein
VRTFCRLLLTVGVLVALGYFTAAISATTEITAFNDSSTPGTLSIQFALGIAIVLGWASGAGVERLWSGVRDQGEPFADDLAGDAASAGGAAFMRATAGILAFFLVVGIAFAFEALGVGLGGR